MTTPNPPPPPFSAQNRSGFEQALATLTSPSAVDDFRLQQARSGTHKPWSNSRSRRPGSGRRRPPSCSHRLAHSGRPWSSPPADVSPDCAWLDRHGRLRLRFSFAAGAEERVVQDDGVHVARPDEKRVGGVRCSLVAVAAALHHEPQIVRPREIRPRRLSRRRLLETLAGLPFMSGLASGASAAAQSKSESVRATRHGRRKRAGISSAAKWTDALSRCARRSPPVSACPLTELACKSSKNSKVLTISATRLGSPSRLAGSGPGLRSRASTPSPPRRRGMSSASPFAAPWAAGRSVL